MLFFVFTFRTQTPGNSLSTNLNAPHYSGKEYEKLPYSLTVGLNIWNTKSVLSNVFITQYFAFNLQLDNAHSGRSRENASIDRQRDIALVEKMVQGNRTYKGSYIALTILIVANDELVISKL